MVVRVCSSWLHMQQQAAVISDRHTSEGCVKCRPPLVLLGRVLITLGHMQEGASSRGLKSHSTTVLQHQAWQSDVPL
jgi:hypothetical protein